MEHPDLFKHFSNPSQYYQLAAFSFFSDVFLETTLIKRLSLYKEFSVISSKNNWQQLLKKTLYLEKNCRQTLKKKSSSIYIFSKITLNPCISQGEGRA